MMSPLNVLLGNLAFSNILNSVFVKLVSAILCGYAAAVDKYEVIIMGNRVKRKKIPLFEP